APPPLSLHDALPIYGALALQLIHDVSVVNDLLAHVDRPVADLERLFDDVDRPNHSRAEAAQLRHEQRFHGGICRCRLVYHVTVSTSFSSGFFAPLIGFSRARSRGASSG